tara:strand:+ start:3898 stop:4680 length:783 start_codon:yes stop_codon:yes gene_type:complete
MINFKELIKLSSIIKENISEKEIFQKILNLLKRTMNFEYATIFFQEKDGQLKAIYSINSIIVDLAADFNVGSGSGISGWVSNSDDPVIIPCFMNENPKRKFNSFISIPLIINEKRIGVINLGHSKINFFKKKDKVNFNILGSQLALILDRINLIQQINKLEIDLKSYQKSLKKAKEESLKNIELSNTEKNIDTIIKNINNSLSIVIGFTDLLINKSKSGEINLEFINEKLPIIMESARKIDMILHNHKHKSLRKITKDNK